MEVIKSHARTKCYIGFCGGTQLEIWTNALISAASIEMNGKQVIVDFREVIENSPIYDGITFVDGDMGSSGIARMVAAAVREEHGIGVLPMYSSTAARTQAYSIGDSVALLAVVDALDIIDDSRLSWEQIVEVRADADATVKLRAFRHWIDSNCD